MRPGDAVFLSASVPYRPAWMEGAQPAEIEEAIVSVARAVFARRGRLVFGGHPSVSPLIASVAGEYFPPDPSRRIRPVVTFQSRFFEGMLPDETTDMARFGWCDIVWTDSAGRSPEQQAPSLKTMRDAMLDGRGEAYAARELGPPVAMIGIGGMEGIRDEAAMFLLKRAGWERPAPPRVHLFASVGGAAARLLDADWPLFALWPEGEINREFLSVLEQARRNGDLVDVERDWWREQTALRREEVPLQPYAAIAQRTLDTLAA